MKLCCLGDSLTYGYGVPRKDCWVSLTAARTGHTLVNKGVNGDTTGGMLARFPADVLREGPDRVLLMGGANDIMLSGTDAQARANMGAMVHQAVAAGVRPMLGLLPPVYPEQIPAPWTGLADFAALAPVSEGYRNWLLAFAGTFGVQVVDFSLPQFRTPGGGGLYLDGIHPGREGHRLLADALCRALPAARL